MNRLHWLGHRYVWAMWVSLIDLCSSTASLHLGDIGWFQCRVMGQTTLSRFQGDTVFGLLTRIASTFAGGVIGLVMWCVVTFSDSLLASFSLNAYDFFLLRYASCGSTRCEPYGFTAVCAVCFPFCFFVRLYWRTHVMTNMILFITVGLVGTIVIVWRQNTYVNGIWVAGDQPVLPGQAFSCP